MNMKTMKGGENMDKMEFKEVYCPVLDKNVTWKEPVAYQGTPRKEITRFPSECLSQGECHKPGDPYPENCPLEEALRKHRKEK